MKQVINITSKAEIKAAVTNKLGDYNLFEGDICNNNLVVKVNYFFYHSKLIIFLIYWDKDKDKGVKGYGVSGNIYSKCSTVSGLIYKVSNFLNVN